MEILVLISKNERQYEYYLNDQAPFEFDENIAFLKKGALWYLKIEDKMYDLKIERQLSLAPEGCFYEIRIETYYRDFKKYIMGKDQTILAFNHEKSTIITRGKRLVIIKDERVLSRHNDLFINGQRVNDALLKEGDRLRFNDTLIISFDRYYLIKTSLDTNIKKEEIVTVKNVRNHLKRSFFEDLFFEDERLVLKLDNYHEGTKPSLFFAFLSSFLMALGMSAVAFINVYLSLEKAYSLLEVLSLILMPLMMLVMALLNPLFQYLQYRLKTKKELKLYDEAMIIRIHDLKNRMALKKARYEQYLEPYLLTSYPHVNYRFIKSPSFMALPLAFDLQKNLLTFDREFEKTTLKMEKEIVSIQDVQNPLFMLDLKKYRMIRILTSDKNSWIFRIILYVLRFQRSDTFKMVTVAFKVEELFKEASFYYDDQKRLSFKTSQELNKLKDEPYFIIFSDQEIAVDLLKKNMTAFIFNSGSYEDLLIDDQKGLIKKGLKEREVEFIKSPDYKKEVAAIIENEGLLKRSANKLELLNYEAKEEGIVAVFGDDTKGHIIKYDITEDGIGPHALVGGSTGSGKSEWLISFILSLALGQDPDTLRFVLIDFKGNSLSQALSYQNKELPHMELCLDNIDAKIFKRYMYVLRLELIRREKLFSKIGKAIKESVMDLKAYRRAQKLCPEFENIPYLLFIVDEFAELKKSNPSFIKDLVSLARVGRSLGIMMVLATQNPQSAVDDEIMSNVSYKVALKFKNTYDLRQFLGKSEINASFSKGGFYLSFDDELIRGQAYYSGAYVSNKKGAKVKLLNDDLKVLKSQSFIDENTTTKREVLTKKIIDKYKDYLKEELFSKRPQRENLSTLLEKYDAKAPLLGEYDAYQKGEVGPKYLRAKNYLVIVLKKTWRKELAEVLLMQDKAHYLYLGRDFHNLEVEKIEKDDLWHLFYRDPKAFLIIEDINHLLQDEKIYQLFKEKLTGSKIKLLAFNETRNSDSYRLNSLFDEIIDLSSPTKEEMLLRFGQYDELAEDMYVLKGHSLLPFYLAKGDKKIKKREKDLLIHLPETFRAHLKGDELFLGYEKIGREAVFIPLKERVQIYAVKRSVLDDFKEVLGLYEASYALFENEIARDIDYLIFIGEGFEKQFVFKDRTMLNKDELYLYDIRKDRGSFVIWKKGYI